MICNYLPVHVHLSTIYMHRHLTENKKKLNIIHKSYRFQYIETKPKHAQSLVLPFCTLSVL